MKALIFMIEHDLYHYHCDPWYVEPGSSNYLSVKDIAGQVDYKGEVFVVHHTRGQRGSGGMDEGFPPSVDITRIRKAKAE